MPGASPRLADGREAGPGRQALDDDDALPGNGAQCPAGGGGEGACTLATAAADLHALVARAEAAAGGAAAAALLQAALSELAARTPGLRLAPSTSSHSQFAVTPPASSVRGRALWRKALATALAGRSGSGGRSSSSAAARPALDPWSSARFATLPMRRATRHRYDAGRGAWTVDTVLIKLEAAPFAAGAMREVRRMVKLSTWGSAWASCEVGRGGGENGSDDDDGKAASTSTSTSTSTSALRWDRSPAFVAKRYRARGGNAAAPPPPPSAYLTDVRLQMDAKRMAESYNRTDPPKKVDVIAACALEVHSLRGDGGGGSPALAGWFAAENAIQGEYVKYNSNAGYVAAGAGDGCPADLGTAPQAAAPSPPPPPAFDHAAAARYTPQAFSHFTFEVSGGDRIVVDIQGVGDYYTDPQIHSAGGGGRGQRYGAGDLGVRGVALFLLTHECNALCARLGLPAFQRCDADAVVAAGGGGGGGDGDGDGEAGVASTATAAAARAAALSRARTGLDAGAAGAAAAAAAALASSAASASAVVRVGGGGGSTAAPPPPTAEDAIAAAAAAPTPPSRHARFHFEAARAAAEIVALAELHPRRLVTAARRSGLFHLRRAAAGGWPRALGVLARVAAGLPPESALLAGLVAAGAGAGEVVEGQEAGNEAVAAALAAAGARAGCRAAAAAAAAYAAEAGDPEAAADWLAAALAPPEQPVVAAATAATDADADAEAAGAEAEFASLPGGGRAEHELLSARAELAAGGGDAAGAAAAYEAAAEAATAAGAGKAAARYWEAAAAAAAAAAAGS